MRNWQKEASSLGKKFKQNPLDYWDKAMEFLLDYQAECEDLGIVDSAIIDDMVARQANEWGWERVACFISEVIHDLNSDYYRIDGYGNLDHLTDSDIECWLYDIAKN